MKVLLLNLPYPFDISRASRWPEKTKSGTLYYPYWLCYAAGVLLDKGYDASVVDCITRKMTVAETVALVQREAPDYLVCELTTSTCTFDYETIGQIKTACPDTRILVGGTHATALSEQVMRECPAIDAVLRQEFDFTVSDLLEAGGDHSAVPGVTYRDASGAIKKNADRPWVHDLDALPFVSKVYQRFLNPNDYCYAFAQRPMIQIFSARGCPFRCNFCSYPETMSGRTFRRRSVQNFVDEIEYILTNMPEIREIFIEDDTFTADQRRVTEICDEILRRGLRPVWSCNTRATLSYETMEKMKRSGCRLLVVGYESGSQRVLDETKKGITLAESLDFAKNTKKLGLKVFGCFMIGLKGDTLETIEETFQFAKKVYPDMCFFQQAVPFPGTAFYEWVKAEGYLVTEDYGKWLNPDGYLNCLVDYPYADHREIRKLRDKLMSRYYFSFTYIVKTFLKNLTWQEFTRVLRGGFAYIWFRIKELGKNDD